jgi:hypothetical protein
MIETHSQLWSWLKFTLGGAVETQRIESGGTGQGVFDVNALYNGVEVWIELKVGKDRLSPEQRAWCVRRVRAGGRCWILTHVKDNELNLWDGHSAVIERLYPDTPICVFGRNIDRDWLRNMLFGINGAG